MAIALYERSVPFEFLMVDPDHPANAEAIARLAPTGQFPVLIDGDRVVIESAAIIEFSTSTTATPRRNRVPDSWVDP